MTRRLMFASVACALLLSGASAHAATDVEHGWFWQGSPAPPPPYAPADALLVEGRPTGPSAVAAVRAELPDGGEGVSLTLRVRKTGTIALEGAVIEACAVTSDWEPGGGQPFGAAPRARCEAPVVGIVADDESAVTFAVTTLVEEGDLDVLIRPGKIGDRPAGIDTSTFSVVFELPTDEDLAVAAGGDAPTAPPAGGAGDSFGSVSGGTVSSPAPALPVATPSFTPALEPAPLPAAAPAVEPTAPAATRPEPTTSLAAASPLGSATSRGVGWSVLLVGTPLILLAWRPPRPLAQLIHRSRSAS